MNSQGLDNPLLNPKSLTDDNQYLFQKSKRTMIEQGYEAPTDSYNQNELLMEKNFVEKTLKQ
jgi:hypothetical protein